jgi:hypothetical protein
MVNYVAGHKVTKDHMVDTLSCNFTYSVTTVDLTDIKG